MILDLEGSQEVADIRSLYRCGTGKATRDAADSSASCIAIKQMEAADQTSDLTIFLVKLKIIKTVK